MQMIRLNEANIADEHICCAISDKKCSDGDRLKKDWLKVQFKDGHRFQKMDVRNMPVAWVINSIFYKG